MSHPQKNLLIASLFFLTCFSIWNTQRATKQLKELIRLQQTCAPIVRVHLKANSLGSLPQPPAPEVSR